MDNFKQYIDYMTTLNSFQIKAMLHKHASVATCVAAIHSLHSLLIVSFPKFKYSQMIVLFALDKDRGNK